MELIYINVGDYLLPSLTIEKQNNERINKYGYLRLNYLKKNNKPIYNHLVSVSIEAENRLNILMNQYKNLMDYCLKKVRWITKLNG